MKKIALTLLTLFLITPCLANIHINPSTVESVVKEFVPADKVVSVISEYNNQLKQSNGTGISAQKLWNICAIAGWDIKKPNGKSQCQKFVNALVKKSSIKFYHACAKENKGKAGYICVDDFFTNKIYGGTQVNLTPGQTLAKEYARLKHNDSTVQCRNKFDPGTLDDTLMCTSHNKNAYYEFVFDDLEEPKDKTIQDSVQNAICRMYDAKPTTAGCTPNTPICWGSSCAADSAKCAKINQSMAKFGYSATYKNNKCEINFNSINDKSKLKTAYGIDNFVFCHGIQVANTPNVETYLKQYVAERAGVSASSVKCDSGFNTYTGTGCTRNGITDLKDDIKTCHVGNNQIDFVFDDINEKWKKTVEGGVQGMSCVVSGGTYSGERCIGLGEQQCNILRQSNLKECPECKAAKWDKDTESCILPSSADAQNLQKGVNITLIAGGVIAGVVITVATFGGFAATAAAAGAVATGTATAAQTTAIVFTSLEAIGGVIELNQQFKINGIADDFLVESNKCKNATCAKKMLSQNLQRMANYANDMTAAEADAVDSEMARLANLIPDDDEIWATMLVNGTNMADNKLGFFDTDSWEPEQVWRAVGIGLQLTSLITGITKWAISKSSRVVKSTAAIKQKFTRAIQSIDNAPESTLRAKRLALKQLAKNGKKVSIADDVIVVPKGQLAAEFHGYNTIETNTVVGIRTAGLSDEILFDVPSQYPKFNKVESFLNQNGYKISSYLDNQAKAVYEFDVVPQDVGFIDELLQTNGFRYSKKGNTFILTESDLAQSFPQYAHLENPIVSKIIQDTGGSQDINQILQNQSISVDDKLNYLDARAKYSKALSGTVQNTDIKKYASTMYDEFVHIIANDATLSKQIMNFDHLSDAEKMTFASNLTKKYNQTRGCTGLQCSYGIVDGADAHQLNGVMEFNSGTTKHLSRDQFVELIAHENNHWLDENVSGFLNQRQATIANNTVGGNALGDDIAYKSNLSEQVSYSISEEFSKHSIIDDILNKMPEHILMKLQ